MDFAAGAWDILGCDSISYVRGFFMFGKYICKILDSKRNTRQKTMSAIKFVSVLTHIYCQIASLVHEVAKTGARRRDCSFFTLHFFIFL
jgi:hypothetical protein